MPWKVEIKQENSYGLRYVLLHPKTQASWEMIHKDPQPSDVQHKLKKAKGEKLWPKRADGGGMGMSLHWELGPWIPMVKQRYFCILLSGVPWGDWWWPEAIYIFPLEVCLEDLTGGGDFWILRGKERKS